MNASTHFKASINRKLREHWTPEQALAIHDLLSEFAQIIWRYYEIELTDLIAEKFEQKTATQRHLAGLNEDF